VTENAGNENVWHTGSQAGFRAFIERGLTKKITVHMLTNQGTANA
jgi:hypothetical protein